MALEAVQNTQKSSNSSRISYFKAASLGALASYSLKYIMPITAQEKDENYKAALKEVSVKAKNEKLKEISKLRAYRTQSEVNDTFIRMYDANKLTPSKINKLKKSLREELINVIRNINETVREKKLDGIRDVDAITKNIRPTGVFVIGGIVFGLTIAAVNNIVKKINENNFSN